MARARPGSGNFAAVVTGRAAHAGRNPRDGRNAVVAAADLALRLARAQQPALSINPAKIDGGGPNNIVPAHAVLRFNLRPRGPKQAADAQALIDRLIGEVAAEHDVAIRLHGGFGRPPKPVTAAAERLFALVAGAAAELDEPLEWRDTGGVCDGNNIAACGTPVIDTMGACGDFIHSPDEYLEVDSLVARARLTALVLRRLDTAGTVP
jgi:glutamate carboxypeptidase